jgi:hypothetical protein
MVCQSLSLNQSLNQSLSLNQNLSLSQNQSLRQVLYVEILPLAMFPPADR